MWSRYRCQIGCVHEQTASVDVHEVYWYYASCVHEQMYAAKEQSTQFHLAIVHTPARLRVLSVAVNSVSAECVRRTAFQADSADQRSDCNHVGHIDRVVCNHEFMLVLCCGVHGCAFYPIDGAADDIPE